MHAAAGLSNTPLRVLQHNATDYKGVLAEMLYWKRAPKLDVAANTVLFPRAPSKYVTFEIDFGGVEYDPSDRLALAPVLGAA